MLSENHARAYREVAAQLEQRTGHSIRLEESIPWPERQRGLLAGDFQLGFLCGLPYVEESRQLDLLGAPVMRGDRYQGRPIYFSDVVVRSESPYQRFEELRGTRWCYNEPGSHSGYNVVRSYLARHGWNRFFASAEESGSHLTSLDWVRQGRADASAIDTTVPESLEGLRVIKTLGPSPIQPAVASLHLEPEVRHALRSALLEIRLHDQVMTHFAPVVDADYDPIRRMLAEAGELRLA